MSKLGKDGLLTEAELDRVDRGLMADTAYLAMDSSAGWLYSRCKFAAAQRDAMLEVLDAIPLPTAFAWVITEFKEAFRSAVGA